MGSEARSLANDARAADTVDDLISELRPLGRTIAPVATPTGSARPRSRLRPIRPPMRAWMVWSCVALGVLLGAALPEWPYAHSCGWGLSFYLFSVGVLVVAGVWGQLIAWKSRLAFAHTIALATMIWGLALTANVVLPRVGYAKSAAAWTCQIATPPR